MRPETPVEQVVRNFRIDGSLEAVEPLRRGHIHRSWISRFRVADGRRRFVHQRLNRAVFAEPERVMTNIERVTRHLREKLVAEGLDPERRTLNIVPAADGRPFYRADDGEYWRTYRFIEGTKVYDTPVDQAHVYQVGRAFAAFSQRISDLGPPPLFTTIPGFADTARRFARFREAVERDSIGRADGAAAEIEFASRREQHSRLLADLSAAGLPCRIAHHDTKINNVLIDERTGEGICVIDLDTVMDGSLLYDFGDAVRFAVCRAAEDEPDPGRVSLEMPLFEALTRGFLGGAGGLPVQLELEHLVDSAISLTYVAGLRFLTDHLDGDHYFGAARSGQNLDRCRAQFALVAAMESSADRMREIVDRCRGSG